MTCSTTVENGLWADTPQEAVYCAIQAQVHPVWRQLWAQCLTPKQAELQHTANLPQGVKNGMESRDVGGSAKSDPSVIVAGIALSVPIQNSSPVDDENGQGRAAPSSRADGGRRYVCVSLGSGSRCLSAHEDNEGSVEGRILAALKLADGHAEVMARRGFVAFLLELAEAAAADNARASCRDDDLFLRRVAYTSEVSPSGALPQTGWALKESVGVHLVCTRWMCGSLAAVAGGAGRSGHVLMKAGCGCWASESLRQSADAEMQKSPAASVRGTSPAVQVRDHVVAAHYSPADGDEAYACCARVKPGRGRPNLVMSCTDKVWRWCMLGLQGRRRAAVFPLPIRLSSVHILRPQNEETALAAAVDACEKARALLEWRTRAWWPQLSSDAVHRATPQFVLFDGVAASDDVSKGSEKLGGGDSSYSRSQWMTVHRNDAGLRPGTLKRLRSEDAPRASTLWLDWRCDGASKATSSLVLNTKAGLPQGMSMRGLVQCACKATRNVASPAAASSARADDTAEDNDDAVVSRALELTWRQCPLSRPWMAHRVACVVTATSAAAVSAAAATAGPEILQKPPQLPDSTTTEKVFAAPPSVLDSIPRVPMAQLSHLRHVSQSDCNVNQLRFLWTAVAPVNATSHTALLQKDEGIHGSAHICNCEADS